MKILVICQYYYPEPFRHNDFCEELVKRGHSVTVVTGVPNYPMGEIYGGYEKGNKRDEIINGVKVHRCFTVPRKQGMLHRLLNYYSYSFSSSRYVKSLSGDFDAVFVNQLSPVMMARAAAVYKKKHGTKIALYCLDLWPESLAAGGVGRNSFIYKFFYKTSKRIYRQADRLLITSKAFADYFEKEFGISGAEYLPQYAEELFSPADCKKEKDEYFDIMLAGNIGAAQSVNTIVEAARLTSDVSNLRWHIVGDGTELEAMKAAAADLKQIIFYGRKPLEDMPKYYSMADAMLVTMQRDTALGMTLPGKVQTYMAAGKPIICSADGETPLVVSEAECGACTPAEDAQALADAVRKLAADGNCAQLGENSRKYYESHFAKDRFVSKLESVLEELRV